MKVYLVGGAVRDSLLKLSIHDKDWVVVGSSIEKLLQKKFKQVGKDFPVFLHPISHEEYALARTEYKSGKGYLGFKTSFSSDVTLEEDLKRRDLTINAIAKDKNGNFIDPFLGIRDLKLRILRHVSPAFEEDPLRVLRVARFAASLSEFGFIIAEETLNLMKKIVKNNELLYLKGERIWKETEKALNTMNPQVYFKVLEVCGAIFILFPEIYKLYLFSTFFFSQSNYFSYMKKIFENLSYVSKKTKSLEIRFLFLFFCFDYYPIFYKKKDFILINKNFISLINNFCKRLNISNCVRDFCIIIIKNYRFLKNIKIQSSKKIINFLNLIDAWRNCNQIKKIVFLMNLNFLVKQENYYFENNIKPGDFLFSIYLISKNVSVKPIILNGFKGVNIRNELFRQRVLVVENWRNNSLIKN
ncbi:Multifunctional CCA protein [Buchnera aphidicola (Tetraneura ulmi)]|uniref:tRNA CCA-pyrophosphorylase n=1 Tax=Buchnera aphidicola TaxID=9 RepID=UPI003464E37C